MAQQTKELAVTGRTGPVLKKAEGGPGISAETLRAIAVYQDYSEGTTGGLAKFAKDTKFSRMGIYKIIQGKVPVSKRFIDACDKLGYSSEWITFGTGYMLKSKKTRLSITDIAEVKAQLQLKDVIMSGMQKQIDLLKNELKDMQKTLAHNKIHYKSH